MLKPPGHARARFTRDKPWGSTKVASLVVVVGFSSACVFDASVQSDAPFAQIVCDTAIDCPEGWTCREDARRCIPNELLGGEAASVSDVVVAPARAAPGDVVRVTFASTPLAGTPEVSLSIGDATFASVDESEGAGAGDRTQWTFEATLPGDAGVDGTEQTVAVVATLVSEGGVAGEAELGSVVIDRAAPDALVLVSPEIAGVGATVTISVDANEEITSAALVWDGAALDVEESARGLDFVAFTQEVGNASLAGTYTLAAVEISDAVGNVATIAVDRTVTIDVVAPVLDAFSFDQDTYGGDSRRSVTLSFSSDGPLARLDGALGAADMACTSSAPTTHACTGSLDDLDLASRDESVVVVITALDAAGNLTVEGRAALVDVAPPSLVSSDVVRKAPPGSAGGGEPVVLVTQSSVDVELVISELLPLPPVVVARDAAGVVALAFDLDEQATVGSRFVFRRVIDTPIAAGTLTLEATFVDRGANVVVVAVPDGGLVVADVPVPSCVAVDAAGDALCTDFDGDGHFGTAGGCTSGDDCDDTRATTRPGGIEIAGNGFDDDCDGVSAPLAASNAIFVAPEGNAPCAVSSANEPCADLAQAIAAAGEAGRPVYLREGSYALDEQLTVRGSVIGGFGPGFVPGGGVSDVVVTTPIDVAMFVDGNGATRIEGLRIGGPMCAGIFSGFAPVTMDVSRVDVVGFGDPDACTDSSLGIQTNRPGVISQVTLLGAPDSDTNMIGVALTIGARLVDASIDLTSSRDVDGIHSGFDGTRFVARVTMKGRAGARAGGVRTAAGATVLSSAFDLDGVSVTGIITNEGFIAGTSLFAHVTVRAHEGANGTHCGGLGGDVDVRAFLCSIEDEPFGFASALTVDSNTTLTMTDVVVDGTDCLVQSAATGNCSAPAGISEIANAGFANASEGHALAAASPLASALASSVLTEASSAAAIDLDGQCRGASDLEAGADEL